MTSNYKEIKNFIHNEEGFTKEEIRQMIQESINIEVKQVIEAKKPYIEELVETYSKQYIDAIIENGMHDKGRLLLGFKERVSSALSNAVGSYVATQLDIQVNVKESEAKE